MSLLLFFIKGAAAMAYNEIRKSRERGMYIPQHQLCVTDKNGPIVTPYSHAEDEDPCIYVLRKTYSEGVVQRHGGIDAVLSKLKEKADQSSTLHCLYLHIAENPISKDLCYKNTISTPNSHEVVFRLLRSSVHIQEALELNRILKEIEIEI